jgi:hypothetical protein
MSEEAQAIIIGGEVALSILGTVQSAIAAAEKAKDETAMLAIYRGALVAIGNQLNEAMRAESNHYEPPFDPMGVTTHLESTALPPGIKP